MKNDVKIEKIEMKMIDKSEKNPQWEIELQTNQGNSCKMRVLNYGFHSLIQEGFGAIQKDLIGKSVLNQGTIDTFLQGCREKTAPTKGFLCMMGGISAVVAEAGANSLKIPIHQYIGGISGSSVPTPMMSMIQGGELSDNNVDIQEYLIVPRNVTNLSEQMKMCHEVHNALIHIFHEDGIHPKENANGAFCPNIRDDEEVLDFLMRAIDRAGYVENMAIAMNIHANRFYHEGKYIFTKRNITFTTEELIKKYENLASRYPILAIEDGLASEDLEGWKKLTKALGNQMHLVGNSLFQTNQERLQWGIRNRIANSILINPMQAGTITEAIETVKKAKANGYVPIMAQCVEKSDSFAEEFAKALNMKYIKC